MTSPPLISCLMVTRGDLFPARFAIEAYRTQSWRPRELVIVVARPAEALTQHVVALADPSIRLLRTDPAPLGALRNIAVAAAQGDWVALWDDDDLCAPTRLADQMAAMGSFDAVLLQRLLMWWPRRYRLAVSERRGWEGSMIARREAIGRYPEQPLGEDSAMIAAMIRASRTIGLIDRPDLYCYVAHGRNAWPADHFDGLFNAASQHFVFGDYDRAIAQLQQFPIEDYRAALDARYDGPDGA